MSYKVKLQTFEGPFDLLVYLIENAQMNIYDIQIAEITGQYMDYINKMKAMDFAVATEFMVLAATLIDIKSKMILPRTTVNGETVLAEDPRSELVERILEYKKYKRIADELQDREEGQEKIFEKPQEDISEYLDKPDIYLSLDINQFAKAFNLFLNKKKRVEEVRAHYTRIEREKATIETRMVYIKESFRKAFARGVRKLSLNELIPDKRSRYDIVVTFVSVLQMMRDRFLDAEQSATYGPITVYAGKRTMEEDADEQ